MALILITRQDGGVSILDIAQGVEGEAEVQRWRELHPALGYVSHQEATVADIPADRSFRDAWVLSGGAVTHDIAKCKTIAHDRRRAARDAEMAPLDIKATIPSEAAQAEAARQVVRDKYAAMQAAIDAATTVEQIKAALQ